MFQILHRSRQGTKMLSKLGKSFQNLNFQTKNARFGNSSDTCVSNKNSDKVSLLRRSLEVRDDTDPELMRIFFILLCISICDNSMRMYLCICLYTIYIHVHQIRTRCHRKSPTRDPVIAAFVGISSSQPQIKRSSL